MATYPTNGSDAISGTNDPNHINALNGDDTVSGLGGDDTLDGWYGNDVLHGGDGNDVLLGYYGNDFLSSGNGNDALNGQEGRDTMTGGPGTDLFLFSSASDANWDRIADYHPYEFDVVDLSDIDAVSSLPGDQAFTLIGANAFTGAGQLRCFAWGGNTYIQGDTGGDLLPEFTIEVAGIPPFIDFYL
jgi:Ca2+-binding RTX toxin-like protein